MAKQKKRKDHNHHEAGHLEKDWQAAAQQRAAVAYEHEILRRTLRPLGCAGLFDDLEQSLTASRFNNHSMLQAHYPLHLEVRFSIDLKPLSKGPIRRLFDLERLLSDLKSTAFYKHCAWPTSFHADEDQHGFAVIFANTGTGSLIVHNRPDLTEGPPLASTQLRNGCSLQVHWFEPFIDDVADSCRIRFAEDGSKLMDRIQSNYPFRQAFWEDWARRLP